LVQLKCGAKIAKNFDPRRKNSYELLESIKNMVCEFSMTGHGNKKRMSQKSSVKLCGNSVISV
jgi:hypothetical protein